MFGERRRCGKRDGVEAHQQRREGSDLRGLAVASQPKEPTLGRATIQPRVPKTRKGPNSVLGRTSGGGRASW